MGMLGRVQRLGGLCPGRAAAGRRRLPSRHGGSMPRPTPRTCGGGRLGHGKRSGPRIACRSVPSPAPCPRTLACSGGRQACALLPNGDAEAGSEARASAWEELAQGEGRRALSGRCASAVAVLNHVPGDTAWTDEGLPEQGLGAMRPASGVKGGSLDGIEALCHNVCRAPVGLAQEGLQGRAAGAWHRFAGGPAAAPVTKQERVLVLQPVERLGGKSFSGCA